jgi:hypothetical protein
MFLAFAYLFVGLGHATAHVLEVKPTAISIEMSGTASDSSDDADSKQPSAVAEHCQVYAPILMPVVAPVAARLLHSVQLSFLTPRLLPEDHPWLDTPPPKHLT